MTEQEAEKLEEQEDGEESHETLLSRSYMAVAPLNTQRLWIPVQDWALQLSIIHSGGEHIQPHPFLKNC